MEVERSQAERSWAASPAPCWVEEGEVSAHLEIVWTTAPVVWGLTRAERAGLACVDVNLCLCVSRRQANQYL